ncbi:MAG: hypothetical protein ACLS90_01625 [Clostridia bacterium]
MERTELVLEIESKLKKFQEVCLDMSNKDKQKLEDTLNKKAESKIQKEIDLYSKKLNSKLEREKIKLEKDFHKKNIDLQLKAKKQLLSEKERENQKLFHDCINSLKNYVNTNEYTNLLHQILENSLNYLDNTDNLTIYVTNRDVNKINFSNYGKVKTLEDNYIGGLILENNDMIIDNTFLTSLKEKIYGTKENN